MTQIGGREDASCADAWSRDETMGGKEIRNLVYGCSFPF
jgi:hypothetical protein